MNKNNYKIFQRKRILKTPQEVKRLIDGIEKYGLTPICIGVGAEYKTLNEYKAKNKYHGLQGSIIINLKDTKIEITSSYGKELCKPTTYIFNLNGDEEFKESGLTCFAEFSKYYKIPKASEYNDERLNRWFDEEKKKYTCSARPILGYNNKYNNQELDNCYEYDLNSAYFNTLLNKIPDLHHIYTQCRIKKNQVGFLLDNELTLVESEGLYADYVFDLIDTPEGIKKYADVWYSKKQQAKENNNTELKLKAKAYLNLPIGYTQRYNPFFRAYVVHKCNRVIKNLIDDNCLFWNTDAIFTKVKRLDLHIGNNIGDFKEEYCKTIRYKDNVYQINDEIPIYRGVNKTWLESFEKINNRKFNLLLDEIPGRNNKYTWNWKTLKLEVNEIWQKN